MRRRSFLIACAIAAVTPLRSLITDGVFPRFGLVGGNVLSNDIRQEFKDAYALEFYRLQADFKKACAVFRTFTDGEPFGLSPTDCRIEVWRA